jgi:hypothetical protein
MTSPPPPRLESRPVPVASTSGRPGPLAFFAPAARPAPPRPGCGDSVGDRRPQGGSSGCATAQLWGICEDLGPIGRRHRHQRYSLPAICAGERADKTKVRGGQGRGRTTDLPLFRRLRPVSRYRWLWLYMPFSCIDRRLGRSASLAVCLRWLPLWLPDPTMMRASEVTKVYPGRQCRGGCDLPAASIRATRRDASREPPPARGIWRHFPRSTHSTSLTERSGG